MPIRLYEHQLSALEKIRNGCILCGGVGSGKTITALSWYYLQNGGSMTSLTGGKYVRMPGTPKDLYIITTARKRDLHEWEGEMIPFLLGSEAQSPYGNTVVVDSWNNIQKYTNVENAVFLFDEQRVVGYGAWTKAFLRITKQNNWILLSATPGDTWTDYIPVFIANGFYRNKSEFIREHVVYKPRSKYPQIDRYEDVTRLMRLRKCILVDMDFERNTHRNSIDVACRYDISFYKSILRSRTNPYRNGEPILNAGELCYTLRRAVNEHPERVEKILDICRTRPRVIVFYNFDYELDILKNAPWESGTEIGEWNGHKHQPIPKSDRWVYLVQYTAGAEGWNCVKTDTIIFYSQTYSYRSLEQSMGRIDRLNTPFRELYYYHLKSLSPIDVAISRALKNKKKFNETKFVTAIDRKVGKDELYEKMETRYCP